MVVAGEDGLRIGGEHGGFVLPALVVLGLSRSPCLGLLGLHGGGVAFGIDGAAVVGSDLLGQFDGEAVGVVEPEGQVSGDDGPAGGLDGRDVLVQHLGTAVDGGGELVLFDADDLLDVVFSGDELGICSAGGLKYLLAEILEEGPLDTKEPAVAGSPSEEPSQDVAPALVGGKHSVADHEGDRPDVVGDDPDGDVVLAGAAFVLLAAEPADLLQDGLHGVHVVD